MFSNIGYRPEPKKLFYLDIMHKFEMSNFPIIIAYTIYNGKIGNFEFM